MTACAGGQAGYLGVRNGSSSARDSGGRGGNGGDCIVKKAFAVTPHQAISITVGKGGTTAGTPGTATVIGSLITLAGGNGDNNGKNNGGGSGGRGGYDSSNSIFPENGLDGIQGSGGSASSTIGENRHDRADGGGGGGAHYPGSIFGKGGDGIVIIEW